MNGTQTLPYRESRSTRRIEVFLRKQDGRELRTLVTNISNRGCRLNANGVLSVDELVQLKIPRVGSVTATIRWVSKDEAGVEFIPGSDFWEAVTKGEN